MQELPDEIIMQILLALILSNDFKCNELLSLMAISRRFNNILHDNTMWQLIFEDKFPDQDYFHFDAIGAYRYFSIRKAIIDRFKEITEGSCEFIHNWVISMKALHRNYIKMVSLDHLPLVYGIDGHIIRHIIIIIKNINKYDTADNLKIDLSLDGNHFSSIDEFVVGAKLGGCVTKMNGMPIIYTMEITSIKDFSDNLKKLNFIQVIDGKHSGFSI